jgi:oligosaccharide 4-alpha-D-glucosyltransferase
MSMSGVPYVHSDAGGFAGGEGDNELYVRWLQFAAFTPIFRPHGTALYEKDTAAFSFPSEAALIDEPYKSYAKDAISLRYLFLPYNYSLAYKQAKYGEPLIAPLYYHFPADTTALKIQDQYMWGKNVLVAPVLEKGSKSRRYYLPEGNWYNGDHGRFEKGKKWNTDSVSLSEIPIFYKEGSFLLLNPFYKKSLSKYKADSLFLVYVSSDQPSSYEFYNDDGVTNNTIQKKSFELIKCSSTGILNNQLKVVLKSSKGNYLGKLPIRSMFFFVYQQKGKPSKLFVNGKEFKETKSATIERNTFVCTPDNKIGIKCDLKDEPIVIQIIWD